MKQTSTAPGIAHLVLGGADRPDLAAATTFLAWTAGGMDRDALLRWLGEHVVGSGRMLRPTSVFEPGVGVAVLDARFGQGDAVLARIVQAARERTLAALTGLTAPTPDDGFVMAALFATRVRRPSERSGWIACPRPTDALSDIVLALFVSDILARRDDYDLRLRVCRQCGALAFDASADESRTACRVHPGV